MGGNGIAPVTNAARILGGIGRSAFRGDLSDSDHLAIGMARAKDAVFHVAADTSPWRGHRERQMMVNLGGTKAVIAAARTSGIGRLVHVSSISVWGHHSGIVNEDSVQTGRQSWVGYVKSKALAEDAVREAVAGGLDAVIVNPTHILGRYDTTGWARLFLLMDKDALPGVPPGGGCFANAGEVARAMVCASTEGVAGQNYILGGPHASFLTVAKEIARLLGKPEPMRAIPAFAMKGVARLHDIKARITGREPDITPEAAYFVCHDERASSGRAKDVLGYRETALSLSLKESHDWLLSQGLSAVEKAFSVL